MGNIVGTLGTVLGGFYLWLSLRTADFDQFLGQRIGPGPVLPVNAIDDQTDTGDESGSGRIGRNVCGNTDPGVPTKGAEGTGAPDRYPKQEKPCDSYVDQSEFMQVY
jgi:hypothetical protein